MQHDYTIANQGFPATRADLNNVLQAIATCNKGSTAPATQYAGQMWIDDSGDPSWILYLYDGTDNIQVATIDTSANTINFTDSALDLITDLTPQLGGNLDLNSNDITGTGNVNITGNVSLTGTVDGRDVATDGTKLDTIATSATANPNAIDNVVEDTTPQLGGMLDVNGNAIGDGVLELLKFIETASAVNELTITNSATGNAPELSSTGDDTNIDIKITPKGSGNVVLDGLKYPNADGTADQVLKTDGSGNLSFADASGGGLVLQVVSTSKTDTYSETIAANTMSSTDITGLSASITPSSSSNKILIIASLATGRNSNDTNSGVGIAMFRDGSLVGAGDTASSRTRLSSMSHHASDLNITTVPINFLDSPSTTSSTTYTFRFLNSDGDSSNLYLNRSANDANGSYIGRCISTVTLIEVSA